MSTELIKEAMELVASLEKEKLRTPKLCESCMNKVFKDKCFFYWENKSFCSQHTGNLAY